eukprot:scaffold103885_cov63-Cyclotella_meneghiniana.AAC.1
MIAMRIRTFIPPDDLEEMSFDKENLIVRFGLYKLQLQSSRLLNHSLNQNLITYKQTLIRMMVVVWRWVHLRVVMMIAMAVTDLSFLAKMMREEILNN